MILNLFYFSKTLLFFKVPMNEPRPIDAKENLSRIEKSVRCFFSLYSTTVFIATRPFEAHFGLEFGFGLASIKTLLYTFLRAATNHDPRISDMLIWR